MTAGIAYQLGATDAPEAYDAHAASSSASAAWGVLLGLSPDHEAAPQSLPASWVAELRRAERGSWITRFASQLQRFRALPHGWDTYEAPPPSTEALEVAETTLEALWRLQIKPNSIAPMSEGGVVVSFRGVGGRVSIECFNSGEAVVAVVPREGAPSVWETEGTLFEVMQRLGEVSRLLQA